MSRFKLTIEYEGGRYAGWQVQQGERTIQGAFFDACKVVFDNQKFEFYGSGRTDSGVHALMQVAHLDVTTKLTPAQIQKLLNDKLPHDINITRCESAHPKFHARHDATARSYVYLIAKHRTAFGKPYVWWVKQTPDIQKMKEVASLLTGLKDFKSFTDKNAETTSTKVEVKWIDIHSTDDFIAIHITGSHFLWKMVRRIVGVMVDAGKGGLTPNQVRDFFNERSEIPAKLTAPASGLFLEHVYYDNQEPQRGVTVIPTILSLH